MVNLLPSRDKSYSLLYGSVKEQNYVSINSQVCLPAVLAIGAAAQTKFCAWWSCLLQAAAPRDEKGVQLGAGPPPQKTLLSGCNSTDARGSNRGQQGSF